MAKQAKPTFEEAMATLEAIVAEIEQGKTPLEESIEKYGEGIALVRQCRTILDAAEEKIQLLAKGQGDTLLADGELDKPSETE
jgi:exodeoxyribonuclease VII small subunit